MTEMLELMNASVSVHICAVADTDRWLTQLFLTQRQVMVHPALGVTQGQVDPAADHLAH